MGNLSDLFGPINNQPELGLTDPTLPQDDLLDPLGGSGSSGNQVDPTDITNGLDDVIKSAADDDLYLGMGLEEASKLEGDELEDYFRTQILAFLGDDLKNLDHDDLMKKIKKYQDHVKAQATQTLPDTIDRLRKQINKLMKRHDVGEEQKKTLDKLKDRLHELKSDLRAMIGEELASVVDEVAGVHMRVDTALTITNDDLDEDMGLLIIDATGSVDNMTMDEEKIRDEAGEVFKDKNGDGKMNFWDEVEFQKEQTALNVSKDLVLQADVEVELKHYDEASDTMTMTWKYKDEIIEVSAKGWSKMRVHLTHESNVNAEKLAQWKEQFSETALDSLYIGTDEKSVSARMFIEHTPIDEQLAFIPGYKQLHDPAAIDILANKFADGDLMTLDVKKEGYKAIINKILLEYNKDTDEPTDIDALWDDIFETYLDPYGDDYKRDVMNMVIMGLWKENKELIPVLFNDNLLRIERLYDGSDDPEAMAMVLFIEYKMAGLTGGETLYGGSSALETHLISPTAGKGGSVWAWDENTKKAIESDYQAMLDFLDLTPGFNPQVIYARLADPDLFNPKPDEEEAAAPAA